MLVAAQTAPQNSYRNPVEHIMSVLNIGLQSVGVMRKEMSDECETIMKSCNSMEDIRKAALSNSGFQTSFTDSLQSTMTLLTAILSRLSLKEPPSLQTACSEEEIDNFWQNVRLVDSTLQKTDTQKCCSQFRLKHLLALQSSQNHLGGP